MTHLNSHILQFYQTSKTKNLYLQKPNIIHGKKHEEKLNNGTIQLKSL